MRLDARRLLIIGLAGNIVIVLVWVASRTTGLPVCPEPAAREAVEFIDLLATIHEILATIALATVLRARIRTLTQRNALAAVVALAVVVARSLP